MVAEIILGILTSLLAWTYLLYPLLVHTLASISMRRKGKSAELPDPLPSVSVIMSVYNEEEVLGKKMHSLLTTDYPHEKTEFLIGSDGSTDGTDRIMQDLASSDKRIRYHSFTLRRGKPAVLNSLASLAKGSLLIITDANVIFSPDTVRMLVSGFTSARTGLCDATVVPASTAEGGVTIQENLYSRFETSLKRAEGIALGTIPGPYGGCYAIRRELFPVIPENMLVDDLFAGLTVLKKGYGSLNVRNALVNEDTEFDIARQFRRRVRIASGSFQNLFYFGPFPSKKFCASLAFISHKVIRWFSPLLIALFFMTTVILSGRSVFYFCLASVQMVLLILPALDLVLDRYGRKTKMLRYMTQFLLMNVALAAGFVQAARGIRDGIWEPTKRVSDDGKHKAEQH